MSTKNKAVFAACASMSIAMISMTTTAVLAYIIKDYASQGVPVSTILLIMTATPLVGLICSFAVGPVAMCVPKKVLLLVTQVITLGLGIIFVFMGGKCPYSVLIVCGGLGAYGWQKAYPLSPVRIGICGNLHILC